MTMSRMQKELLWRIVAVGDETRIGYIMERDNTEGVAANVSSAAKRAAR